MALYILFLALILAIRADAGEATQEDGVYVLTDANFEPFVTANPYTFVEFYAPWCGHCQQLTPIFVSSAKASEVPFGKVDCTANKQICEIYQIQGYPTLKLFFSSGKAVDFEGERDEATILAFLQKKTGPPSLLQTESEGLASFLATESNSRVVAYIEESSDNYATWKSVTQATGLDSFVFAHVASSLWGDHKEGSIDLLVGSETYSYTGAFEADSILTWIMEKGFPIVDSLSQESWTRAQKHPSSKILVAVFYDNSEEAPAYLETVATSYISKVVFTSSDSPQILERWGGSGKVLPSACVINFSGEQPDLFTWDEEGVEFNEENLRSFIDQSIEGTYKSNVKSEPIPEQSPEDPVTILVAKNFHQVLNDEANDVVLVDFYAPWCGHCKKLNPIYDELGAHFAKTKAVIAKIDATANTLPKDLQIQGFPTLIAFVKGERHLYSGAHELEPLTAFVQSILDGKVEKKEL